MMEIKRERKMKNRATNYLTKSLNYQIKGMVDTKSYNENVLLCEKSMEELKKIYWHEKELLIVIPMLISNATTFELVETLTVHIIYLRKHIKELEKKFPFINQIEVPNKKQKNIIK
jgi:hypothetical protein